MSGIMLVVAVGFAACAGFAVGQHQYGFAVFFGLVCIVAALDGAVWGVRK